MAATGTQAAVGLDFHDIAPGCRVRWAVDRRGVPGGGNVSRTNSYVIGGGQFWVEPVVNAREEADAWIGLGREHPPEAVLLTHHHPDHLNFVRQIADAVGVPVWGPARGEVPAHRSIAVDRLIEPGCVVGSFEVLPASGHHTHHVVLYDGTTMVLGDAHTPGDGWPHDFFATIDRLIEIDPEIALPAHGRPYLEHSLKRSLLWRMQAGKGMP